jgi:hypothetical protein
MGDYEKFVPRANQVRGSALAKMIAKPRGPPSRDELVKALSEFRGRLLLLIGHIDPVTKAFLLKFDNGQTFSIGLPDLQDIAREHRLDIIPVGCHSAEQAPIGASGFLHSRDVMANLGTVFAKRPPIASYLDFYSSFTSQDLQLTMNAGTFDIYRRLEPTSQDPAQGVYYYVYGAPSQPTPSTTTTVDGCNGSNCPPSGLARPSDSSVPLPVEDKKSALESVRDFFLDLNLFEATWLALFVMSFLASLQAGTLRSLRALLVVPMLFVGMGGISAAVAFVVIIAPIFASSQPLSTALPIVLVEASIGLGLTWYCLRSKEYFLSACGVIIALVALSGLAKPLGLLSAT